jgi:hypothetical protein
LPVYNILRAIYPPASLFYTVLTGYAGLGATLSTYITITFNVNRTWYLPQRENDRNKSGNWIYEIKQDGYMAREVFTGLKKVWINLYLTLSSLVYANSSTITTLFSDNARME